METINKPSTETINKASSVAHETVDKIFNATHQAVEALDEKGEQLKNAEQMLLKNCQGYIRDHPVTSLGIAVAAGFLLSRSLNND